MPGPCHCLAPILSAILLLFTCPFCGASRSPAYAKNVCASTRTGRREHLPHICPPGSLHCGLGCSLLWPSVMGTGLSWVLLHQPPCWLTSTPRRLCTWTTVSSRPAKEDSLSLQECLSWFSAASSSNIGSLGDPHRSAPQECCWMSSQLLPGYHGTPAPG